MMAYGVARLHDVRLGPDIVAYLERIDATLAPFGGHFLIHGGVPTVLEGSWSGDLIVIAFPDLEQAKAWYGSPAYQAILPLRTQNSVSDVILINGAGPMHRATDVLPAQSPPQAS